MYKKIMYIFVKEISPNSSFEMTFNKRKSSVKHLNYGKSEII